MTANQFLLAMNDIADEHIVSAQKRMGYTTGMEPEKIIKIHPQRKRMRIRKSIACIAAVVALLLVSFVTAMAASEDFRMAVFSFFHISVPEAVLPVEDEPLSTDTVEKIYENAIEESVSVEYVRIDGDFDFGNGIIYLYKDEARNSADFYTLENGTLLQLDTRRVDTSYEWNGNTYEISFDWCEHDGNIATYGIFKAPANDTYWTATPIPGRSDLVELMLSYGRADEYSGHIVFLELATQTVIDPFDGCGVDQLKNIVNTEFSPGLNKALISCGNDHVIWYCDMDAKALVEINTLLGTDVSGSWFIDDDTLCFYTMDKNYRYSYYTRQLSSGVEKTIIKDVPRVGSNDIPWGLWMGSDAYQLYLSEDGELSVIDMRTGTRTSVEGFSLEDFTIEDYRHTKIIPNRSGNKALYVKLNNATTGLGISQIGVLDFEQHVFKLLDREGYEERHEATVSWFDDNHPVIWAVTGEYGYLYLYSIT